MALKIERANPSHASELCNFARQTFCETFAAFNTPEDMASYLEAKFSPEIQKQQILSPNEWIYLARQKERVVGYYHLIQKPPHASVTGLSAVLLDRFYIDQAWQGLGLAHTLMKHCMDTARGLNFETLWLGVWDQNYRAQRFYKKWNFIEVGELPFQLGQDLQRDIVLERQLDLRENFDFSLKGENWAELLVRKQN